MGPVFTKKKKKKKNPYTWVQFSDWAQIFSFLHGENKKNGKICQKWGYFSRKIRNDAYPFLPKWPFLKDG